LPVIQVHVRRHIAIVGGSNKLDSNPIAACAFRVEDGRLITMPTERL
jgi:hypothetical protein